MAGVGILSMATGRGRKRWVTKLTAAPPYPLFFPRSPPPPLLSSPFLSFPSLSAPEGSVIDFIRNNRRAGELRPAQARSPVTRVCWLPV